MSLKIEFINDQPMINHQQQSQQAVKIIKVYGLSTFT